MKKIYLHIGLQKTGSTFLQKEVFTKVRNTEIIDYKKNPILKSKKKKIIISDETLSGDLLKLNNKKKILSFKSKNTKIILVLRNQKDYLFSAYNYMVSKGVEYRTFNSWLKKNRNKSLLKKLSYVDLIKFCWLHFGKKNTLVLFYEDLEENKIFFLNQISKFFKEKIKKVQNKKVNYSIKNKPILLFFNFINISFFLFLKKIRLIDNKKFSKLISKISKIYYFIFRSAKKYSFKINALPFEEKVIRNNYLLKELLTRVPKKYFYI